MIVRVLSSLLATVLAPAFVSRPAHAMCTTGPIEVWPPSETVLPRNAVFILTDVRWRGVLECLGKCTLMLAAADDQVCLVPGQSYFSGDRAQRLLKPTRLLKPGREYALRMSPDADVLEPEDLLPYEDASYYLEDRYGDAGFSWLIRDTVDRSPPEWRRKPAVDKAIWQLFGCGIEAGATVVALISDESPMLLLTTVAPIGNSKAGMSFLMPYDGDAIFVGAGMCGGPFGLAAGESYTATFRPTDAAWNSAKHAVEAVSFTIPARHR